MVVSLISLKMRSDSLPKRGSIFPEFQKSSKRKRKEKTRKLRVIQRVQQEQNEEVFGKMASWPAVA